MSVVWFGVISMSFDWKEMFVVVVLIIVIVIGGLFVGMVVKMVVDKFGIELSELVL